MGCLGRITGLVLVVCFFGILWGIPQIMQDPTMPWENKAFFSGLGLFVDLLLIAAAIFMRYYAAQQNLRVPPIHFRR